MPGSWTLGGIGIGSRIRLQPPFDHDEAFSWRAAAPWRRNRGDSPAHPYSSAACLYEDGVRLPYAHAPHDAIRLWGRGLYSHFERLIWFSTSDGSDPNTNGRTYEVDTSLDLATWRQHFLRDLCTLWDQHPQGALFRSLGGDAIPPPVFCSLGLTNKCNLRCEICGSQKFLDETGIRRRHMDTGRFDAVAATLFPVVAEVELNSQGDPLLYPEIERVLEAIQHHRCDIKVQTNGTLFTDRVIDLLCRQSGTVMLSLDAVGPRFDEVRRGGDWARAAPGLDRFLRRRDPGRLAVGAYPTVTRRTLADAVGVVEWAAAHDLDEVAFHRYNPIQNSFEEAPSADELKALKAALCGWAAAHDATMAIRLDGELLNGAGRSPRRRVFADPVKQRAARLVQAMMAPMDLSMRLADPVQICAAPQHYVEIGLEGQIAACCRAQDVALGVATSVEAFAGTWFGHNYQAIRDSLRRDSTAALPLPNCESCIAAFAPDSLHGRKAIDYGHAAPAAAQALRFVDQTELEIEVIQKETGHCHIAIVPPGIELSRYALFEGDSELGPGDALHDDIRDNGGGRYSRWGRSLYFSASDNSDARRNGRRYTLKRRDHSPAA